MILITGVNTFYFKIAAILWGLNKNCRRTSCAQSITSKPNPTTNEIKNLYKLINRNAVKCLETKPPKIKFLLFLISINYFRVEEPRGTHFEQTAQGKELIWRQSGCKYNCWTKTFFIFLMNDRHDHWVRKEIKRKPNNYFFYECVSLFRSALGELAMDLIIFI